MSVWRTIVAVGGGIIAATAREYGCTLVTRDKPLLDYGREGHVSVLSC